MVNVTLSVPTELWFDVQPANQAKRFYRVMPGRFLFRKPTSTPSRRFNSGAVLNRLRLCGLKAGTA
jgi:hypothetical protein